MAALAIALLPAGLSAQGDGTITGVVTDQATQQPVPGAQVVVVGTQRGAMTDGQGQFSITAFRLARMTCARAASVTLPLYSV
jgi:hypothetical protein